MHIYIINVLKAMNYQKQVNVETIKTSDNELHTLD